MTDLEHVTDMEGSDVSASSGAGADTRNTELVNCTFYIIYYNNSV